MSATPGSAPLTIARRVKSRRSYLWFRARRYTPMACELHERQPCGPSLARYTLFVIDPGFRERDVRKLIRRKNSFDFRRKTASSSPLHTIREQGRKRNERTKSVQIANSV